MSIQCWNAFAVVGLYPRSNVLAECYGTLDLTCVGNPRSAKQRCGIRIGKDRRESAARSLANIGSEAPRDHSAHLIEIARQMLCRHHADQASIVSERWSDRLRVAEASGQIPTTLSAIPRFCPRPTLLDELAGTTWDPFYTFEIYPDEQYHCPHEKCTMPVAIEDRRRGCAALSELGSTSWTSSHIMTNLKQIATLLLCKNWHRTTGNARSLARKWHRVLEQGLVVHVGEKPYSLRTVEEEQETVSTLEGDSAATASYAAAEPQPQVAVQVSLTEQPVPESMAVSTPEPRTTGSRIAHGLATPPSSSTRHPDAASIEEGDEMKEAAMLYTPDPQSSEAVTWINAANEPLPQQPSTPEASPLELDLPTPPSHDPFTTSTPSPRPSRQKIALTEEPIPAFTIQPPPEPQNAPTPRGSPPRPPTPPRVPSSPSFLPDFPTPPSTISFTARPRTADQPPSTLHFTLPAPRSRPPPSPAQPASPTLPAALQPTAPLRSHAESLSFASPADGLADGASAVDLSPPCTPTPMQAHRESGGYAIVASTYTYGRLPTPPPPPRYTSASPDAGETSEVRPEQPIDGPVAVDHYVTDPWLAEARVRGRARPDGWDALSLPDRPRKLSLWRRMFCGLGVSSRRRAEDEKRPL